MSKISSKQIDALLPQTQCGDCSYQGCLPYAKAISEQKDSIDRCLPGGVALLKKIAALVEQDPSPYLAEMEKKQKPAQVAVIREDECIGCTKCIQACPVDAIIGSGKMMHTIISDQCTGCELCIEPCPVDCIDLLPQETPNEQQQQQIANLSRQHYQRHLLRENRQAQQSKKQHQQAKDLNQQQHAAKLARKEYIAQATARAKAKKNSNRDD